MATASTSRDPLDHADFGTFQPATGVHIRYAHVPPASDAPPRGQLLLLHGRGEFIEKYDEVIGELTARGWAIWTMDWRGQGLSSRALRNAHKGHVDDFEDYLYDLDAFVTRFMSPDPTRSPCVILAHSMGGHLALRYLARHPGRFSGAVLSAPMVGVHAPLPEWLMELLLGAAVRLGLGGLYLVGDDHGPEDRAFHSNLLTRDPARFQRTQARIDENPQLAIGGLTVGWMSAALRSMRRLFDEGAIEALTTPVLMVCAGHDQRVANAPAMELARRLVGGRVQVIPDAEHELMMERDDVRDRFWALFRGFVDEVAPRVR